MRSLRRIAAIGTATLASTALVAAPAVASHDVTPERIAGEDRIGTAAEVAERQHDRADRALLANAQRFPDALAAAPAAAALDAPVLLTHRDDLPARTAAVLEALDVSQVKLLGGTTAIAPAVATELTRSHDVQVDRIAGPTRYGTAAELARFVQGRNDGRANFPGGQRAAFLAYGGGFADALSASAPAASRPIPIPVLLTEFNRIPDATRQAVRDLQLDLVVIVGGPMAVATEVEERLEAMGVGTDRVWGRTRAVTATAVADFARTYLDFDATDVELVRGDAFPDALAVGPLAGAAGNPILLTDDEDTMATSTSSWLHERCPDVATIRAIGGDEAVSPRVLAASDEAAESCHGTASQQTYIVAPQEPRRADLGDAAEFEAIGRYDQGGIATPLDVTLFGCEDVDEPRDGRFAFDDADDDGHADGIAGTEAVITAVEGRDVTDTRYVHDVDTGSDDRIEVVLRSDTTDCAHPVFFDDADGDRELDVDDVGDPVEPWGFGQVSWAG